MAANANVIRLNLSGKAGNALLERGQRIENVRDVSRAACPERGLLERIADRLHKANILFSGVATLYGGVIVGRLDGDVSVSGPVVRESFATVLGTAGAVREDDDGVLTRIIRIKNPHVEILVAMGVVENQVFDIGHRVGTIRQLVAAGVCQRRNCGGTCGQSGWIGRKRRRGNRFDYLLRRAETDAARRTGNKISRSQAQNSD